jgi:hypothetical protein
MHSAQEFLGCFYLFRELQFAQPTTSARAIDPISLALKSYATRMRSDAGFELDSQFFLRKESHQSRLCVF